MHPESRGRGSSACGEWDGAGEERGAGNPSAAALQAPLYSTNVVLLKVFPTHWPFLGDFVRGNKHKGKDAMSRTSLKTIAMDANC